MGGLLGPKIVKGNIDIHRMSVDHIGECFRALYLFYDRELYLTSLSRKPKLGRLSYLEQLEKQVVLPAVLSVPKERKNNSFKEAAILLGNIIP
jgi:hypothetical protein